jgi:TonB-dependent SusC/RagA subfamily outer membrane receptor
MKRISSSRTLRITYVGMKPQDVPIKPGTIKVMMKSDSEVLQEVVVTGMQKMDKRLFTGATKQLDADNVKLDGLPDISRGLEGRAAGVSVQNVSGTFGTAPKIRVRGATSIYGSSKPLWVVDGVILEDAIDVGPDDLSSGDAETLISSAIAGLNSDDIESFQILKDGSATSIYGARAMAGVIVVTTKKGRAGVSKISYTGEFTTRAIPSYKEFNIMNSQEQMGIYKEMEQKGWLNSADLFRVPKTRECTVVCIVSSTSIITATASADFSTPPNPAMLISVKRKCVTPTGSTCFSPMPFRRIIPSASPPERKNHPSMPR